MASYTLYFTLSIALAFRDLLTLVDVKASPLLFHRLAVPREELFRLLRERAQKRQEDMKLYKIDEVVDILEVSAEVVMRWIDHGFITAERLTIKGEQTHIWVSFDALEMFRQTYVVSKKVPELLGINARIINKYKSLGKLHPITPGTVTLFLREEIETLKLSIGTMMPELQ